MTETTQTKTDLFGQRTGGYVSTNRTSVSIPGNEILERVCNRLLVTLKTNPELLDGDTIGEVDTHIFIAVAWETAFKDLVTPERKHIFESAMAKVPSQELLGRARRELQSRDYIRLSSKAVKSGEYFRQRIAGAMK